MRCEKRDMDPSDLFNTDTGHWKDKSTTEQISYLGNNLPRIAVNFEKSIEQLQHKMEESDEVIEKKVALENAKVELQKLVSVTETADHLLEKLEVEVTTPTIEDVLDEEAFIEDLAETIEVDLSDDDIDDDIDIEDDLEFEQDQEISDNS